MTAAFSPTAHPRDLRGRFTEQEHLEPEVDFDAIFAELASAEPDPNRGGSVRFEDERTWDAPPF